MVLQKLNLTKEVRFGCLLRRPARTRIRPILTARGLNEVQRDETTPLGISVLVLRFYVQLGTKQVFSDSDTFFLANLLA